MVVNEVRELGPPPARVTLKAPANRPGQPRTTLYDIRNLTATDLGPGGPGSFSPDSTLFTWAAGDAGTYGPSDEVWVLELSTGRKWSLGQGSLPVFGDNSEVFMFKGPPTREQERMAFDVHTGQPKTTRGVPSPSAILNDSYNLQGGHIGPPGPVSPSGVWVVYDAARRPLLKFDAPFFRPAGLGEVLVTTPPVDGLTNIYIISIATGQATFIATAVHSDLNWPIAASADYVIWTDGLCEKPGNVKLYKRKTGTITEIRTTQFVDFTPNQLITFGAFGASALIDPETLEYVVAMPSFDPKSYWGGSAHWSPDYAYASTGAVAGHGGPC